jgi:hypothetical protein
MFEIPWMGDVEDDGTINRRELVPCSHVFCILKTQNEAGSGLFVSWIHGSSVKGLASLQKARLSQESKSCARREYFCRFLLTWPLPNEFRGSWRGEENSFSERFSTILPTGRSEFRRFSTQDWCERMGRLTD